MALDDIIKKSEEDSQYITIGDGESFEGKLLSVEAATGSFGPQNNYTFEIDGKEKVFSTGSIRLLRALKRAKVKEGDTMRISAEGDGTKRQYSVDKLTHDKIKK